MRNGTHLDDSDCLTHSVATISKNNDNQFSVPILKGVKKVSVNGIDMFLDSAKRDLQWRAS